jgi:L-malate glycosyltransferase
MDPLNIVKIFYARPHLGGSGIMSMEAAKELAKRGHSIDIVSYPGTFLTPEEEALGLRIHPVEKIDYPCFKAEPFNATIASQIANLHTSERPIDIIHANYAITHGDAAITAREIIKRKGGDPKVVITNHGSDIHTNGHHDLMAPYLQHTLSLADEITFVSQALQDESQNLFALENQGVVVYNFVDENRYSPPTETQRKTVRNELNLPEESFVVYHASNFRPIKNTSFLVDVATELQKTGQENVYWLMVGDGPEREELEKKVINSGLKGRIKFVGRQDDVVPYLHASDAGILCSERESFGLALLEAGSCGLPMFGSDTGGIPEVISEGNSGYIFPKGDYKTAAHRISQVANSPELQERLGVGARKEATDRFSREQIVNQYESLYQRLLEQN